ncbi:NAD(+) synthase [candidate division KSB1 bacterium]|nr:NAD(+) synthase [candidate division KSB1 bacterium]
MAFKCDLINIIPETETEKITENIKATVSQKLRRKGAVVGISGGIDSSVVLALCVRALGEKRVLGVMLPEKDSSPENFILARKLVQKLKVDYVIEDITPALIGFKCYQRRDDAIRNIFPEYDISYKVKIGLPSNLLDQGSLNVFYVTIISPEGEEKSARIPFQDYLQIVAASNFKQRSRMCMLYYHAERLNYAVVGTPNKNEHDLGFFVKYGDGGSDLAPIKHLFKTQVFQLAKHLDIPEEIQQRTPTTDTYSAEQTQEEFFFRIPFHILDAIWYGWENGYETKQIAAVLDLTEQQVKNVIDDISRKKAATEYLRMQPL